MKKQRFFATSMAGMALLLGLAACGEDPQPEAGPDLSTPPSTQPLTQAPSSTASTSASATASAAPTSQVETSQSDPQTSVTVAVPSIQSSPTHSTSLEGKMWGGDDYDPTIAARLPHNRMEPGETADILGTSVTICSTGDAYGIHYVGASEGVACELANGVSATALSDESATENVHFKTPKPVRFESRTFTCTEQGNIVLTCVDDNGDSVLMW